MQWRQARSNKREPRATNAGAKRKTRVRTSAGRYERARGGTNGRRAVRTSAGSTIECGGVRTSAGGYKHSRGSSRGYVPLVPRPPPPSHQFFKVFLYYLIFFHILYTCIYNILIRRNRGYQGYRVTPHDLRVGYG
jgi:hypothetical protein